MILLALVVGGMTAYYLGSLRPGMIAAAVSAVALLVSMFVPRMALPVYVLLGMWCAGLWLVKTKLPGFLGTKPPPGRDAKKGWEAELERWKRRVTWLIKNRK